MITILFSAHDALWPQYQHVLEAEFAKQRLEVNLVQDTDAPETIDYLIYAPAQEDDDLSKFTNLRLIQSLWAGPDKLLKNPTLTQPMARMVDPGMTQGMVVVLGQRNIKRLSDFADLSSDELIGGYDEIKGKKIRIDGYLEEFSLSRKEADDLIMAAREIAYK